VKHKGKALAAAGAILTKVVLLVIFLVAVVSFVWPRGTAGLALAAVLCGLGMVMAVFTLYFFRDPDSQVPSGAGIVVAPAHGTVDVIDETEEPTVMGGRCKRVSIFLSVFNVHVQQAPVSGEVTLVKHTPGQYLNAMRTDSAQFNENVMIGFQAGEPAGVKVGVRLITGLIARRIIPWLVVGETVTKGERIALIQFGSRANLYLPLNAEITVKLGDKVVGGTTPMAKLPT
jgi:phosphatidylserine decarboxylase